MTEKKERDILFFIFGVFLGGSLVFLSITGYIPAFSLIYWNIFVIVLIIMSIFFKKSRFLWIGLLVGIALVFGLLYNAFSRPPAF